MSTLAITDFEPDQVDELVLLWRESFEYGVGIVDPHSLAEQAEFFGSKVLPSYRVRVAHIRGRMVGFLASDAESVNQLYVRVANIGRGIGTELINLAKKESSGSLWLYTFARNSRACGFYERHGFVAVARGFEPNWQLEDVRYQWVRGKSVVE
jgi:ribosomal protein S18 acetylase RimI-like enzyme